MNFWLKLLSAFLLLCSGYSAGWIDATHQGFGVFSLVPGLLSLIGAYLVFNKLK